MVGNDREPSCLHHRAISSWSDEWWATIGNLPVCIIVLYHASPQITNCLGTSKDMERHVGPKRDKNHQESWAGRFVPFDLCGEAWVLDRVSTT